MKNREIQELTDVELQERLQVAQEELVRMKLNHSISPLDNPLRLRDQRRSIARMLTEQRKRELNK
ncbi:MAG: 50S ribosomal protein L29 [Paludibacteraceae bacterium]|jgi:large subunit ribosomal protein L29|nr:50S ribosomal protein L29 [Paludibacteraceae bacterium]MBR1785598.1 50S ribosomal protein L29 [Paludibacteraceae bacterium]